MLLTLDMATPPKQQADLSNAHFVATKRIFFFRDARPPTARALPLE
jgi:hypothetical protein